MTDDVELSPLSESGFAVDHGLVGATPDVAVCGAVVRGARQSADLSADDVAAEMTRRGYPLDLTGLTAIEASAATRMHPRAARLLAALVDQPLAAIEAAARPWPAEAAARTLLEAAGTDPLVVGDHMAVRTGTGSCLGLLRCPGDAGLLGARTYRLAAAALLNGPWSHLAGALLVTDEAPYWALAVDALDCVTRSHAPTGLSGYSRLAEPEPLAAALASYDRAYVIGWSDPPRLRPPSPTSPGHGIGDAAAAARELVEQARRARQPGKRSGMRAAAEWLGTLDRPQLAGLLAELARRPPEDGYDLVASAIPAEVAP